MFPLGTVLFPTLYLPLHVFEPRYREMTRRCLDGDREFGVVLIERGSEVGGHDVRTRVGTVARIVEVAELGDGRYALGTVGVRRVRINEWLADDPFPRADVEDWDDPDAGADGFDGAYRAVVAALRRVLALKAELGEPAVDATVELSDEPGVGSFQVAAVGPFGPADQQALLAADGVAARLAALLTLLADEARFCEQRLLS
jgi:Lon protease-like protein